MARFSAKTWQNCATCQFWLGPRVLNARMVVAEVDEAAEGACTARKQNPRRYATASCNGWQRWVPLEPCIAASAARHSSAPPG